ncbi:MAG: zinc ABC transporter substrate-binding protein [Bacteroidota bacterium]
MLLIAGCASPEVPDDGRLNVVATTSIVADLVNQIGGDAVRVTALMGPGIDPHLYKASEGDVTRMASAEAIFYNGLYLEGRMVEVFEQMQQRGLPTVAVAAEGVPDSLLVDSPTYAGNFDPHIWFDVSLWIRAAEVVRDRLAEIDPERAATYRTNAEAYLAELNDLDAYVRERTQEVPELQRVLVTAHDAFGYFGEAYGFEVRGLQGLSTAAEAGTGDVQDLTQFIVERGIPAMFVESSVPPRTIEAVQAAVRARGASVEIGGSLYSDALGDPNGPAGTYIGTVRHNVDTIVGAVSTGS